MNSEVEVLDKYIKVSRPELCRSFFLASPKWAEMSRELYVVDSILLI